MIDYFKEKVIDILNILIRCYNIDGINDKNQVVSNIVKFINECIEYVIRELSDVESEVE